MQRSVELPVRDCAQPAVLSLEDVWQKYLKSRAEQNDYIALYSDSNGELSLGVSKRVWEARRMLTHSAVRLTEGLLSMPRQRSPKRGMEDAFRREAIAIISKAAEELELEMKPALEKHPTDQACTSSTPLGAEQDEEPRPVRLSRVEPSPMIRLNTVARVNAPEVVAAKAEAFKADGTELLTAEEAADLIGIKPGLLAHWRCAGESPAYSKLGRTVLYRLEVILEFIEQRRAWLEDLSRRGKS